MSANFKSDQNLWTFLVLCLMLPSLTNPSNLINSFVLSKLLLLIALLTGTELLLMFQLSFSPRISRTYLFANVSEKSSESIEQLLAVSKSISNLQSTCFSTVHGFCFLLQYKPKRKNLISFCQSLFLENSSTLIEPIARRYLTNSTTGRRRILRLKKCLAVVLSLAYKK